MFAVGKLLWEMMWIREVNFLSRYILVVSKANFEKKKEKRSIGVLSHFLLTFFNICHSRTLWAKLSVKALNYREDLGISLERIFSVSFYKQKLLITDVLQSWQFFKELRWEIKSLKPHHTDTRNLLLLKWPRLFSVFPEIAVIHSAQTVEYLD